MKRVPTSCVTLPRACTRKGRDSSCTDVEVPFAIQLHVTRAATEVLGVAQAASGIEHDLGSVTTA
jgi:hypothetical protein